MTEERESSGLQITRAPRGASAPVIFPWGLSVLNRGPIKEGNEPTPEELAQRTGVPAHKVRLILESSRKPLSLGTPIGEDSELGDFLEDKQAESPNENLITQDLTTQVERALGTLSPKEKEILRLRFGIGEEGEHTLEEVGRRFSVTRERIRQIEAKAIRKLRHPLRGRALKAFVENGHPVPRPKPAGD